MNNIIANLRRDRPLSWENRLEAADEIFRLREENERLREALKPFAELAQHTGSMSDSDGVCVYVEDLRAAAAAIREGGKE